MSLARYVSDIDRLESDITGGVSSAINYSGQCLMWAGFGSRPKGTKWPEFVSKQWCAAMTTNRNQLLSQAKYSTAFFVEVSSCKYIIVFFPSSFSNLLFLSILSDVGFIF